MWKCTAEGVTVYIMEIIKIKIYHSFSVLPAQGYGGWCDRMTLVVVS